jgi:hypothetical protein
MAALVDQICGEFKLGKRYSYYEEAARETAGLEGAVVEMQPWLPFAGGAGERCGRGAGV